MGGASSTGMRIGDMLELTTNSVKPYLISGYTLTWYDHKNRKERQPMPIPNECAIAIEKLIEHTKEIRKQDNKINNYLFVHKVISGQRKGEIIKISQNRYYSWLNGVVEKDQLKVKGFVHIHNILDKNGKMYNFTAHQFRRTLGTDMLSKGIDLKVIQEVLGHNQS